MSAINDCGSNDNTAASAGTSATRNETTNDTATAPAPAANEQTTKGNCQLCTLTKCNLFTVNTGTWEDFLKSNRNLRALRQTKKVCGFCLKGRSIPVLSRKHRKWIILQVEGFDWQTGEHRVKFDNDSETVVITSSPFSDYVQSFQPAKEKEETIDDAGLDEQSDCDAIHFLGSPIRHKSEVGNQLGFKDGQFCFLENDDANRSPTTDESKKSEKSDELNCFDAPIHFSDENWSSLDLLDEGDGLLSDYTTAFDNEPKLETFEKEKPSIWRIRKPGDPSDSTGRMTTTAQRFNSNTEQKPQNKVKRHRNAKKKAWTPMEDATLCILFDKYGAKWTQVVKLLPGRNASSAKNRYQAIRRKMDDLLSLGPYPAVTGTTTPTEGRSNHELVAAAVDCILALRKQGSSWQYKHGYQFGPFFHAPMEGAICGRCMLLVPSDQTGREICSKTKWCRPCTNTPPFVSGDLLRKMHKQQHEQSIAIAVKAEPGSATMLEPNTETTMKEESMVCE